MLCSGKQKHVTTVYHVIWAELSEDTLTVSFIEKKKKTRTVCIKARLLGSTKEEAVKWVEDLLNVAYKGAILTPSLWTEEIPNLRCTRYQA
jgi:alkyl hydroperoxide reductase subunit AhpC